MKIILVFLFFSFFVSSKAGGLEAQEAGLKASLAAQKEKIRVPVVVPDVVEPAAEPAAAEPAPVPAADPVEPVVDPAAVVDPATVVDPAPVPAAEPVEPVVDPATVVEPAAEPAAVEKVVEKDEKTEWLATQSIIQIYKYDSDRENCSEPALEPWDMQKVLEEKNVKVLSSEKGYDGLFYSIKEWGCRSYPPRINIFSIPVHSYEIIKKLGFHLCKELEDMGGNCYPVSYSDLFLENKDKFAIHIYKYSGRELCVPDSGIEVNSMEQELIKAKVVVYQRYSAVDGLRHSLACGERTGAINVYVIEKAALAKSISMGYRECAYLKMIKGGGCHSLSD